MKDIIWLVVLLKGIVCWLLLMVACRLCEGSVSWYRYLWGAALGGAYSGACLLTGFHFLGNWYWRLIFLALTAWLVFGADRVCMGGIYVLLDLLLSVVTWEQTGTVLLGIIGVYLLLRLSRNGGSGNCVPVELTHNNNSVSIRALRDTGNTLVDPLTGQQVLIVGAQVAMKLLGLTREQLRFPVEAIEELPGYRLIPYKTIGSQCAMLLAKRFRDVQIGNWRGSRLVAFAPENLNEGYEALTGGFVC